MNRLVHWWMWLCGLVAVACPPVLAQQPPAEKAKPPYRKLAPGVMETVHPARELEESFSRHDVVELLAFDPSFDWAKKVPFRHDIWTLEFKFKPMRMIWVDVPQASGQMKRKLIWYTVYSVTNRKVEEKVSNSEFEIEIEMEEGKPKVEDGELKLKVKFKDPQPTPQNGWMCPIRSDDGTYKVRFANKAIRFIPRFLLEGHESVKEGTGFSKVYPDRVIPIAVGPIRQREDRNRKFYTTVEICREIKPGETLWGVATWEDVDPRIDRFAVYLEGLTNAYRWQDDPGRYKKGDPIGKGRRLARKILKLNFWRPGDEYFQHEREIRYGIPGGVDYEWVYR